MTHSLLIQTTSTNALIETASIKTQAGSPKSDISKKHWLNCLNTSLQLVEIDGCGIAEKGLFLSGALTSGNVDLDKYMSAGFILASIAVLDELSNLQMEIYKNIWSLLECNENSVVKNSFDEAWGCISQ